MTTFFTADTHFGHGGALGLYRRPFTSVATMNAAMVAAWQQRVGPDDEVWHLGDFALGRRTDAAGLLAALPGRKHLVLGNNDPAATAALPGWASVQAYAEVVVDGVSLVLCHYAFRTWRNMACGAWNLHGHSHGRLQPLRHQVDVGVDAWQFQPVVLAEIMRRRPPSEGEGGRRRLDET
jgi:calcineurin-like phosphoesterase family protein